MVFLPNAILSIALTTLRPNKYTAERNQGNQGIRVIKQNNDMVLIWKTSNVAITKNEEIRRPASVSIQEWLSLNVDLGTIDSNFTSISSWPEKTASGIAIVSTTKESCQYVKKHQFCNSFRCTIAAVLQGEFDLKILESSVNLHNKLAYVKVLEQMPSKTYKLLTLVTLEFPGISPCISQSDLLHLFRDTVKAPCVAEGNSYYLSLHKINLHSHVIDDLENDPSSGILHSAIETIPTKFYKLMKRENLFYIRQANAMSNEFSKEDYVQSSLFCGVNISYYSTALQPRQSTVSVVETVSKYMANMYKNALPKVAVLDIGCGSGAILVAAVANLTNRTIDPSSSSVNISNCLTIATGIDIDEASLRLARLNIATNSDLFKGFKGIRPAQSTEADCIINSNSPDKNIIFSFKKLDYNYAELLLESNVTYDVIVSNPPYFSSKTTQGRITNERDSTLVSGVTGLEGYLSILDAISRSSTSSQRSPITSNSQLSHSVHQRLNRLQSNSLLSPTGVVIFQLPGGNQRAVRSLLDIIKKKGSFSVTEIVKDSRGLDRVLVLSMMSQNRNQGHK